MHWVARPKQDNAPIADKRFVTPVARRGRAVARACCPCQSSLTGIAFTKPHCVGATRPCLSVGSSSRVVCHAVARGHLR